MVASTTKSLPKCFCDFEGNQCYNFMQTIFFNLYFFCKPSLVLINEYRREFKVILQNIFMTIT